MAPVQSSIAKFISRLRASGLDWDATSVAECLWLATQIDFPTRETAAIQSNVPEDTGPSIDAVDTSDIDINSEIEDLSEQLTPSDLSILSQEDIAESVDKNDYLPIKTPVPPALRRTLGIGRSLRPLMRKVDSYVRTEIDEVATAEQIAERNFCIAIEKPKKERWLEVALVIEKSSSSFLWRETIRDFRQVLERQGAFRAISIWHMEMSDAKDVQLFKGNPYSSSYPLKPRSPKELVDASGRRLILFISDCISPMWRTEEFYQQYLKLWSRHGPLTVVQLLPAPLWKRTALGLGLPVSLKGLSLGSTNDSLLFKEVPIEAGYGSLLGLKLPVVTMEPLSLKYWAQMLLARGENYSSGVWFDSDWQASSEVTSEQQQELSPEVLVQRFMTTASCTQTKRLASLMALAPVSLPVIYLLQETLIPGSLPLHMAEVFMSGLVRPVGRENSESNSYKSYDFVPGVRELLIDNLPTRVAETALDRVSQYIGNRIGKSIYSFTALLRIEQELDIVEDADFTRFASLTRKALQRMGGRYASIEEKIGNASESMTQSVSSLSSTGRGDKISNFSLSKTGRSTVTDTENELPVTSVDTFVETGSAISESTAAWFNPFGEADCESEVKLLKQDYSRYFFNGVRFSKLSLDPNVFLIIGRRGSGKTALSQFFSIQNVMPEAIPNEEDEPFAFEKVLEDITLKSPHSSEVAIPRIATIWHFVVWSVIFRELAELDPRIRNACIFGIRKDSRLSTFVRHLLKATLDRITYSEADLLDELEAIFSDKRVQDGMIAVLEFAQNRPVIISFDTLENYAVRYPPMMIATAALIKCGSEFNRDYAHRGIHIKIFIAAEMFLHLKEEMIPNPLRSVRNEVYMHWRPKELMRLISWRFYNYLQALDLLLPESRRVDWDDATDVLEKMWYPYFGRSLRNEQGLPERTFPYVLRHTQMQPRQLIVLCNEIARRAKAKNTFPLFQPEIIVDAIRNRQVSLAEGVLNSYSYVYPKVGRIIEALSGIPIIFRGNELDKRAPITASEWSGEYSPHSFRQLASELGIIGRVRHLNTEAGYAEADFGYSLESRLPLLADSVCAIHPMFYRKLSVQYKDKERIRVYPFPDNEDFEPWRLQKEAPEGDS